MSVGVSPESSTADPIAILQERLGVDAAQAADLASIQVVCPVPGQQRETSLADFMTSEHGASKTAQIVDIAAAAQEKGAAPEEAIAQALGFAAVRNEHTGKLARVASPESKKK